MRDVLEVRCTLEELAVALACKNVTPERIMDLRAANKCLSLQLFQKML